ncbi:MAG TPA: tRNA (adenosine(37)-N6)-threonylcarbamoyltransferase complex dimerization subunit type 1 TsaB [Acidobacteriaceae bacterium]|jgi:tRNA threonylcarbamoyladenosine biosynthesis protein TsaB|nr:tRNA (adenosine(37)-N6)-threonylcarbamoyltransferase complex dimerization subunit type 1 TsaB [Acidobacteriaceae bacterium]
MLLLAIDTAGQTGSVTLATEDAGGLTSVAAVDLPGRTFSARLIPALSELLQARNATLDAVDGFVVVRGPGSFTGLRVGLSAVKGLAEGTGKPVIALSRLAVMAAMQPEHAEVHAILDAGRGEFYYGEYRDAGWQCVRESLETAETLRAALQSAQAAKPAICIVAETAAATTLAEHWDIVVANPTAVETLPLAWRFWQAQSFADIALLDANYLRRSDAELFARPKSPVAQRR